MTYFDNPGLVFPSAFASWATATGMCETDFLKTSFGVSLRFVFPLASRIIV